MDEATRREKAWLGDAVLALFAREWILKQGTIQYEERSAAFIRMTSNQFLACLGEPTAVEARIGEVYERHGLEAAYRHLEDEIVPLFRKQVANRKRSHGGRAHRRRRKPAVK